MALIYRKI